MVSDLPRPPAVTMRVPSGLKDGVHSVSARPLSVASSLPLTASQILPVPSALAERMRLPSRSKATALMALACPDRQSCSRPVATAHTRTFLSKQPAARRAPSALRATHPPPPLRVHSSAPAARSQTLTTPSLSAEAQRVPSLLTSSARTQAAWPASDFSSLPL